MGREGKTLVSPYPVLSVSLPTPYRLGHSIIGVYSAHTGTVSVWYCLRLEVAQETVRRQLPSSHLYGYWRGQMYIYARYIYIDIYEIMVQ